MSATTITCPNCRQPFQANIEQLIDVSRDTQAKARLLSGRLNAIQCPHCGFQSVLATPLAYHDPDKQLLIVHVPIELGLPQKEQERAIGNFTNTVVNSLPQEKRRGYLFTPKMALTMQSMIDMILEADGVTPEMIEAQRAKMRLVETFLQTDPEQLPDLVKQYDAQLDAEFFAILVATAETAIANGREDVAQSILQLREELLELSTVGQQALASSANQQAIIQEVAERLNTLGGQATRDDLIDLMLALAQEGDEKLQVAVGLARTAFDYEFFQLLTQRVNAATGAEAQTLDALRKHLLELTTIVDQQNEVVIKRATDTLRTLLSSPDLDAAIQSRIELIDDTFLAVLSANIQAAEQAKDIGSAAKLKAIFDRIVAILQASAPPAIQFINEIMTLPTFEEARTAIAEHAAEFGPELLHWIDMLTDDLAARGNNGALDRLGRIRDEAERVLAAAPTAPQAVSQAAQPMLQPKAPTPAPTSNLLTGANPPASGKPIIELLPSRNRPRRER